MPDRREKPTFLEAVATKAVLAIGRRLAFKEVLQGEGQEYERNITPLFVTDESKANLVSSRLVSDPPELEVHAPVLDLDFPAHLVPSSTPGHYHLYLDRVLTWEQYEKLLRVLADVGIIETGYADAAIHQRASHARLPYIKKGNDDR